MKIFYLNYFRKYIYEISLLRYNFYLIHKKLIKMKNEKELVYKIYINDVHSLIFY